MSGGTRSGCPACAQGVGQRSVCRETDGALADLVGVQVVLAGLHRRGAQGIEGKVLRGRAEGHPRLPVQAERRELVVDRDDSSPSPPEPDSRDAARPRPDSFPGGPANSTGPVRRGRAQGCSESIIACTHFGRCLARGVPIDGADRGGRPAGGGVRRAGGSGFRGRNPRADRTQRGADGPCRSNPTGPAARCETKPIEGRGAGLSETKPIAQVVAGSGRVAGEGGPSGRDPCGGGGFVGGGRGARRRGGPRGRGSGAVQFWLDRPRIDRPPAPNSPAASSAL